VKTVLCGQGRSTIPAKLVPHAEIRLWERTTLTRDAIKELLAARKCVGLRLQEGYKRAVVIYSEPDDCCFVVVQNYRTGEVVTVLPLEYWAFDRLTESSAQAWQARELVLGAETALAVERAGGDIVVHEPLPPLERADSYVTWHVQRKRLLEALQVRAWCPVPNARPTEEERALAERGKELLRGFSGDDLAPGKSHPECTLVLKLLRDPPFQPIVFPSQLLKESLGQMLVDSRFVATMVRKMASRDLLNEDLLGVHIEIGENRFEFSPEEQRAFFQACVACVEAALASTTTPAGLGVTQSREEGARAQDAVQEAGEQVTPVAQVVPLERAAASEPEVATVATSHLVDQVESAPAAPAPLPVAAPGVGKEVRVKPAPTEFESLLMESGWSIRRPEATRRAFRAA